MSDFQKRYKGTRARQSTTGFAEFGQQISGFASKVVRKMGNIFGSTTSKAEEKVSFPNMQKLNKR